MRTALRIGTRDSQLARWQAQLVQRLLEAKGRATRIVAVKSQGDLDLDTPLYELGITGIFTKTLDIALLKGQIDIAVHSLKDVPTLLPKGLVQAAVLPRANSADLLLHKSHYNPHYACTIATGSLRRKAQWLNRYPHHRVVGLRGNVNTRLEKLENQNWDGAIFAAAGLERIGLRPSRAVELDWMIPAPAQGAVVVVCREDDKQCQETIAQLNDGETSLCTGIERSFLRELEGGCSAPIGALARLENGQVHFKGVLLSLDGQKRIEVAKKVAVDRVSGLGKRCAQEVLKDGGEEIMAQLRRQH